MDAARDLAFASQRLIRSSATPQTGLRVALVHDWLTGMRGGEKCLEVLCQAFPNATLHTLLHRRGSTSPPIERMQIRTSALQRLPGVSRYYRGLLPIMPLAVRTLTIRDVDLVVSLSHCVAKAVVPPPGVPHVCYCFTPMRYAWDGRDAYLGRWSPRSLKHRMASTLLNHLREWDRVTAARVSHFIAISRTIEDRIARCYGRASKVIQPPVDVGFYTPGPNREARTNAYLIVSALVPYKRVDDAIIACSRLGKSLVVIGEGPDRHRLESIAGPTVRFLGWQPNEVIRDHYRACRALLFPGEEDFGIVPIEALACGAPVIALGKGGAAETVDDQVGRIYQLEGVDALMTAIEGWENDGCPHNPALGRARAETLSTDVFRDRLLDYLNEVAAESRATGAPPAPHLRFSRTRTTRT